MRQAESVLVYLARQVPTTREYLLLHRVPMPRIGLEAFWQGVSGGLEDGEKPLQAATRELFEETGIVPFKIIQTGFQCTYPIRDQWKRFYPQGAVTILEHCFLASCASDAEPELSDEHDVYRWCRVDEAMGLLHFPDNKTALRACEGIDFSVGADRNE